MGTGRRAATILVTGTALLSGLAGAGMASAAALGFLRSDNLLATSYNQVPFLALDDFSTDGQLNGMVSDTGQAWTVHSGKFTVAGGTVYGDGGGNTNVTLPVSQPPSGASFRLSQTIGGWNKAGLVMASSADGKTQLRVYLDNAGALNIVKFAGGKETVLSTVVVAGFAAGSVLSVTRSGSTFTASYAGTSTSATLSPADQTLFDPLYTRVGIFTDHGDKVRIDDFKVWP